MGYQELKEKFQREFYINYENFINQQIDEIKKANFLIHISQYTSIVVTEPKVMIQNFLKKEKLMTKC
ncbi:hypothetical protein J2787_002714 [Chryseobacterium rhizosphaerae]|jgi:hypothetical protein|uniref:Uncharacterized protein n=1 Tax=Chryseobacterium rhizosphaerae TaxID=395937 RepID=A0AAE3YAY5_9FLAO|nr:hypothetical protein [Chryseobacterium rhizosphaerae]